MTLWSFFVLLSIRPSIVEQFKSSSLGCHHTTEVTCKPSNSILLCTMIFQPPAWLAWFCLHILEFIFKFLLVFFWKFHHIIFKVNCKAVKSPLASQQNRINPGKGEECRTLQPRTMNQGKKFNVLYYRHENSYSLTGQCSFGLSHIPAQFIFWCYLLGLEWREQQQRCLW